MFVLKEKTSSVMHASVGFHRHDSDSQILDKAQHAVLLLALAIHNRRCCDQTCRPTNLLDQFNTRYSEIHQNAPLAALARNQSCGLQKGRSFHWVNLNAIVRWHFGHERSA